MNKTLLLILCDFLLLTILSMWKMEKDAPESQASDAESNEVSVSAMAMMEQDLLDTLQFALDEEKSEKGDLSEELSQREQSLEETQAELEQRLGAHLGDRIQQVVHRGTVDRLPVPLPLQLHLLEGELPGLPSDRDAFELPISEEFTRVTQTIG